MNQAKLATVLVVLAFYSLRATSSINEARYESNQRLWYPPGQALWDGHWKQHQPISSAQLLRKSVGLRGAAKALMSRWAPSPQQLLIEPTQYDKRDDSARHQYAYIMSPLSEQILQVGGRKEGELIGWPSVGGRQEELGVGQEVASASMVDRSSSSSESSLMKVNDGECQTLSSVLQVSRDETDKLTGQLVRTCKGMVQLNRCEGACSSFVQPSIKSPTGLKKECSCCNEASFRRVQVRLTECYWPTTGDNNNRRITTSEDQPRSYMEIELDEPIECKCRKCDSSL